MTDKLKHLWLFTTEYPPQSGGGISTYCRETVKMLHDKDFSITVFVPDYTVEEYYKVTKEGAAICRFNPNRCSTVKVLGYEANLSYAFAEVAKLYANSYKRPDIIEVQDYMGIGYYLLQFRACLYDFYKDLNVVLLLHSPAFLYMEYNQLSTYKLPNFWTGEMERFCLKAADILVSPSQYLVDVLKKVFPEFNRDVTIIQNPYKIEYNNNPDRYEWKPLEYTFFGKLTPQKGCLYILRLFEQRWRNGSKATLSLVGSGKHLFHPEMMDMDVYIRRQYKNRIDAGLLQLKGAISPGQLNEMLKESKIILVPSIVDNFPYTVVEAMARGRIVLASVQGGQKELIDDGVNGFLFDIEKPESFHHILDHIEGLDVEATGRISESAIQKVENSLNYDHIRAKRHELFEKLKSRDNFFSFPYIRPVNPPFFSLETFSFKKKLLSVVIPYYNMGEYLYDCLKSLQKISYQGLEIIIVNDGSTDEKSVQILQKASVDFNIKIINQQNQGLADARNNGAAEATGEFLAFLDPDDTIEKGYYEKAITIFNTYPNVHFVGSWARYFGGGSGCWPAFNPEPPYILFHNMINSSALIYRRESFVSTGGYDRRMIYGMEDYEQVINMLASGFNGIALPEAFWNYRVRKQSMARQFNDHKEEYLYKLIAQKHSFFYNKYGADLSGLLTTNGPGYRFDNPTLLYSITGSKIFNNPLMQRIIKKMKSSTLLRKTILKIRRSMKK